MTASVRCGKPCGRPYDGPKTPRNRLVSPPRVFFGARHLCPENMSTERFYGKSGADAGLTKRVWVLVPGLSFIPSSTFLIRIWPALRGCGKGRVECQSAWRRIMSQIKAKDVVRCIPHCSALRFWEEKCGVNGLGCRGLQNTMHGQTEDRSALLVTLRSSVPLSQLHAWRQPDSETSKVRL